MAMFGKTYSNDEKRKARADLMEKKIRFNGYGR
jgi:hypothetical protein